MYPGSWPVKIEGISSPVFWVENGRDRRRYSNRVTGKHVSWGNKVRGTGEGKGTGKGRFKGEGKGEEKTLSRQGDSTEGEQLYLIQAHSQDS